MIHLYCGILCNQQKEWRGSVRTDEHIRMLNEKSISCKICMVWLHFCKCCIYTYFTYIQNITKDTYHILLLIVTY